MKKYKITCNDPKWAGNHYHGVDFKSVGYTENESIASEFKTNTMTTGGKPLFEVEEVNEQ